MELTYEVISGKEKITTHSDAGKLFLFGTSSIDFLIQLLYEIFFRLIISHD